MEQTVELAGSPGKLGSSGLGVKSTISDAVTEVGKSVGEPEPPEKHSAETSLVFAMSQGKAGFVRPRANDTTGVAAQHNIETRFGQTTMDRKGFM